MDKSIRLPLVLGELKVPAKELDQGEWLILIEHALKLCRPQVKYFPGYQTVEDIARFELPRSRTKNFDVCDPSAVMEKRYIRLTKAEGQRGRGGKEDVILLSPESELFHWERTFVWEGSFNTGVFSEQLWKFRYLLHQELKQYLSFEIGTAILKKLALVANQGYENRLKHAESMRNLHGTLGSLSAKLV